MNDTSIHNNESFSLKEKVGYTLLGVLVLGGAFFASRSIVRKIKSNNEEKKAFEQGSPADYAQRLKMAFENDGWWGTDKTQVRTVIRQVPSKEIFKNVINSYQNLYASSLMRDLKEELKTTEYNEMLSIIAAKPEKGSSNALQLSVQQYQSWAARLKAAFDITYGIVPGTDEDAIKAVFLEIPTQAAFQQTGNVYKSMYGNDLISDLKSELEFWEYAPMMNLITQKPKI